MERIRLAAVVLTLATQVLAAPPLISLGKNGEVGVNFGGYHASAGLGGLLDGGASGGLHAEAGTPHGQEARAGLAGSVDSKPKGVIGLEEETDGSAGARGVAYADAHSGKHAASASLSGETVAKEDNRRLFGLLGRGINMGVGLNAVGSALAAGAAGLSGAMGTLGAAGIGGSVGVGGSGAAGVAGAMKALGAAGAGGSGAAGVGGAMNALGAAGMGGSIGVGGSGAAGVGEAMNASGADGVGGSVGGGSGAAGVGGAMNTLGAAGMGGSIGGGSLGGTYGNVVVGPESTIVEKHISTNYVTKHEVTKYDTPPLTVVKDVNVPALHPQVHHTHANTYPNVNPNALANVHGNTQANTNANAYANNYANANAYGWAGAHLGVGASAGAAGGIGGYTRKSNPAPPPPQETYVEYKKVRPVLVEKRVDVGYDHGYGSPAKTGAEYNTKVKLSHRNPTFFSDIFNIPIQALSSVSRLVGNAVAGTNISVEKSAFVHADKDNGEASKSVSADTAVLINTPSASSVLDDIFAIPINTLGAVNKFLENNVPARRKVIVQAQAEEGDDEPTQIRLKGKARRRAARRPIIVLESAPHPEEHETPTL